MFSALGLFKQVSCPKRDDCSLPACIFDHCNNASNGGESIPAVEYDPFTAGVPVSPPPKRRKIQHDRILPNHEPFAQIAQVESHQAPLALTSDLDEKNANATPEQPPTSIIKPNVRSAPSMANSSARKALQSNSTQPRSIARPISPPSIKARRDFSAIKDEPKSKPESLTPRNVGKAPEVVKNRLVILQKLYQQMVMQNQKVASGDEKWKALVLHEQELIGMALDEEEEAAVTLGPDIYRNSITQRVLKLKKMSGEEWRGLVMARTGDKVTVAQTKTIAPFTIQLATGLKSEEEIAMLQHLRTPLEGLEEFGYVTAQPTNQQISAANKASEMAAGWEKCDRCGTRFQVFPGRDEHGALTTHGPCHYHWGRAGKSPSHRTDRVTGQPQATYTCCNQPPGSNGCTQCDSHVFKVEDQKRLAAVLQFEYTPANPDAKSQTPVSFDCEMGYTTVGMEVIRVTAVSWPKGEELLDVLVRPYGEVLDLNTRFSGISKEQFAQAPPHETDRSKYREDMPNAREDLSKSLCKVESPAAARQLLFTLLNATTPLIGHAINNDLNVLRIIHPFIIDTVLLYPHPRGLPVRYSLKILSSKYLNRGIQMGGELGHDSREDAVATGDLVIRVVAEKWKSMRLEGWSFDEGALLAPQEIKKNSVKSRAAL